MKERIEKVLVTKEINTACIYIVKFFINGLRTSVIVDDYIPVTNEGAPAFCYSNSQVFWAILIEKAWAKINSSYFKIRRSYHSFLAIHLTGVPAENINHNDVKFFKGGCWHTDVEKSLECWHRILGAFARNYTVVCQARQAEELD